MVEILMRKLLIHFLPSGQFRKVSVMLDHHHHHTDLERENMPENAIVTHYLLEKKTISIEFMTIMNFHSCINISSFSPPSTIRKEGKISNYLITLKLSHKNFIYMHK